MRSRAYLLLVASCSSAVVAEPTTNCCDTPSKGCCPKPSIGDLALGLRVIFDPARCCPHSNEQLWCAPYGVGGCSFCRETCDDDTADCVECPGYGHDGKDNAIDAHDETDDYILFQDDDFDFEVDDKSSESVYSDELIDPEDDEDEEAIIGDIYNGGSGVDSDVASYTEWSDEADWGYISSALQSLSYEFSYDFSRDNDCLACSWDSLSTLEQRLLKQRSRSLVCDESCLTSEGHSEYGVHLCNYFNSGRECRACCQVSSCFRSFELSKYTRTHGLEGVLPALSRHLAELSFPAQEA